WLVSASAPNNPFMQDVWVRFPMTTKVPPTITWSNVYSLGGGVIVKLPKDWISEVDYTWNQSVWSQNSATLLNDPTSYSPAAAQAIGDGTVDVIRDTLAYPVDLSPYFYSAVPSYSSFRTELEDTTGRLAGPIFSLPAGAVSLSASVEHRLEKVDPSQANFTDG